MPNELFCGAVPCIVKETCGFVRTGITATMAPYALARDQFTFAVAVEVSPGHTVCLRPGLVDEMLLPRRGSIRFRFFLLPPVDAVVMASAPDEVVAGISVYIYDQERRAGRWQRGLGMKSPGLGEWVTRWVLVPAYSAEDVFSAVAVDVVDMVSIVGIEVPAAKAERYLRDVTKPVWE